MADPTVKKMHEVMVAVYGHVFPEWELDELLSKRDYGVMKYRHMVRAQLKYKFKATLKQVAQAEGRITGQVLDHSTIINSMKQYAIMEEDAKTDALMRDALDEARLIIDYFTLAESQPQ